MIKIILDIDDCVLDWTSGFADYVKCDEIKNSHKRIHEILNITFEEECKLMTEFNISVKFSQLNLIEGAKDFILNCPFQIAYATSCGNSDTTKVMRLKNMVFHKIPVNEIHFLPLHQDKKTLIESLKSDIIVDDNLKNIIDAESIGLRGFLFDTPWARKSYREVYNWKKIKEIL